MATNPYFKEYTGERSLLNNLTVETISIMGRDMIYLPRELLKKDKVFGEDPISQFKQGYVIEMYIQNINSFGGQINIINKFGINITDRVTLLVAKTRFNSEIASKEANIKVPREGDLIFFPFNNSIFEINYVEDKIPFFQHGILTTYTLTCELFTYSYEKLDTGVSEIDIIEDERKYNLLGISFSLPGIAGSSTFEKGEEVFQVNGVTGNSALYTAATAKAFIVDVSDSIILVRDILGTFVSGSTQSIKGACSSNEFYITGITLTNVIQPVDPTFTTDEVENDFYSNEGRINLNFNKDNPFSEECL